MARPDPTTDRLDELVGIFATGVRRVLERRVVAPAGDGAAAAPAAPTCVVRPPTRPCERVDDPEERR